VQAQECKAGQAESLDGFIHRHIGPRKGEIEEMLATTGLQTIEQLISQAVPDSIRQSEPQRVRWLGRLPESALAALAASVPLVDGVERLTGTLKPLGYKTAILSGMASSLDVCPLKSLTVHGKQLCSGRSRPGRISAWSR
jgi:phosphoserine phosphatase